jgi:hypothetical protein
MMAIAAILPANSAGHRCQRLAGTRTTWLLAGNAAQSDGPTQAGAMAPDLDRRHSGHLVPGLALDRHGRIVKEAQSVLLALDHPQVLANRRKPRELPSGGKGHKFDLSGAPEKTNT